MRVILSVAMSLDGYIDSGGAMRLRLSSAEDLYDVHVLRSECDAILIGGGTLRRDDPSLVTKHAELVEGRVSRGLSIDPVKIVLSRVGNFSESARFFSVGAGEKWIFSRGDLSEILDEIESRGIGTLLVEGGFIISTEFLVGGFVDHLRLAIAPFFVGGGGVRFVGDGIFPYGVGNRARLVSVRQLGDIGVMDYEFS